ncbi:uncharacterized protein MYCFIDRAFT_206459 [Pseudocercospora fijiensis CIRAD86]|uniref:Uncharacterized protein n=1 Tax=Pseudocercospora fijiensis (strain CIRAD86) TaxID=383855 RepID=M3A277_PSEFD|nr:uncharacterized protein MYCFIDRAFT_206459 [Pseudocercospora fijiensis CIRAD86]EME85269.1 hypothetical protein MYCFIDRAFT_206459 [Pseudocercospora fijiensis CIRAD86]
MFLIQNWELEWLTLIMPAGSPHITQAVDSTPSIIIPLPIVIVRLWAGMATQHESMPTMTQQQPKPCVVSVGTARLFDSRGHAGYHHPVISRPCGWCTTHGRSQRGDALRRQLCSRERLKHDHESCLHLVAQYAYLMRPLALDLQAHFSLMAHLEPSTCMPMSRGHAEDSGLNPNQTGACEDAERRRDGMRRYLIGSDMGRKSMDGPRYDYATADAPCAVGLNWQLRSVHAETR